MNNQFHKRSLYQHITISLAGILFIALGLVLATAIQPAQAQAGAATATGTVTVAPTSGVTATTAPAGGNVVATAAPTVAASATTSGTLAAPVASGTPKALVPVTGADQTQQGGGSNIGPWIAVWLVGLILIGFGWMARMNKRQQ